MNKLIIIGFLCIVGIFINAQKITKLEYYIDNDPGIGLANSLTITASDTIKTSFDIPLGSLSAGMHKIYFRTFNDSGKWGIAQEKLFFVDDSVKYNPITSAEYYIDQDPGLGLATQVSITKADSSTYNNPISIGNISSGIHTINFRYKGYTNQWSIATSRLFFVQDSVPGSKLNKYQYFIDKEPVTGSGLTTSIPLSDSISENMNISTGNLNPGIHTIGFRTSDNLGRWSTIDWRLFVVNEKDTTFALKDAEYYLGNDPGVGKATLLPLGTLTDSIDQLVNIPANNNDEGIKYFNVRFRDQANQWSIAQRRLFYSEKEPAIVNNSITRGEYFIDNDPGFRNATTLPISISDSVESQLDYLVLPLKIGKHTMGIRFKDSLNRWSSTNYIPFEVRKPVSDFTFSVNSSNKLVTFTNSTFGTNYFWDFGDLSNSTLQSPQHQYLNAGVYKVCLAVFGNNFELLADTCKRIAVSDTTFASYSFTKGSGNTINFKNSSSSNIKKYYWTFGDGTYDTIANPTHVFSKPGVYNVCLKATDLLGSKSVDTCKTIQVGSGGCKVKSGFSHLIYQGDSIVIFNEKSTLSGNGYFSWNFGDGTTSSQSNPQKIYRKPGFYLVGLTVSDSSRNCIDYYSEVIKVGLSECKAAYSFFVNPSTREVTFISNSVGNNLKYYWTFGDGSNSTLINPKHKYASDGTFYPTLTVTNTAGTCSDLSVEAIQVGNAVCNASFTLLVDSSTNKAFFKQTVAKGSEKFLWTFGDGRYSTQLDPVHQYTAPGYYTVGLTTFNSTGCIDYKEEIVLIGREGIDCESDFIYTVDNKTVNFFDKSQGKISRYAWNFGDGSQIVTTSNPTYTYTRNGFFNVCLTVATAAGVQNITCKRIAVSPDDQSNCFADFNFSVDSAKREVTFKGAWLGTFDKFEWDFGDNSKSNLKEPPVKKYATDGIFLVGCALKNSSTGCKSKIYKTIDLSGVNTSKVVARFGFDSRNYDLKAGGYPVDFIGTGIGDQAKLRWDFGDNSGIDTTSLTPSHVYTVPGDYKVCYTVTDPNTNKSDTYCDTVTTQVLCVTDLEPPVAKCKDIKVTLDSKGQKTIKPLDVDNGSKDDCTLSELSIDKASFNTSNLGANNVILTAKDAFGNTHTCPSVVTVEAANEIEYKAATESYLNLIPNPFGTEVLIEYSINTPCEVHIHFISTNGSTSIPVIRTFKEMGKHEFVYNSGLLAPGTYIVNLETSSGISIQKLVVKQ